MAYRQCMHVVLVYQTTPSAALDVLHHQHMEGVVWYTRLGGCMVDHAH
jgi:hypothetical protein